MPVRSRPFFYRLTLPATVETTLYTVPAGRTAIVRCYAAHNRTAAARNVSLGIRSASGTGVVIAQASIPAGGVLTAPYEEFILGPGDSMYAFSGSESSSTGIGIVASGALLDGVAS